VSSIARRTGGARAIADRKIVAAPRIGQAGT
jgi:hypothetical protein